MHRVRNQPRMKMSTIFMISIVVLIVVYICYFQFRDYTNKHEDYGSRCLSELANVKYQLDSVLEYKNKMDSVINELQQDCYLDKQAAKEFTNSYLLMKQHLDICELQTGDLEVECKKIKAKLAKTTEELAACKKGPPG